MTVENAVYHDARAEEIEPSLQARSIRIGHGSQRWFHHVLLLRGGTTTLVRPRGDVVLTGPALAFIPPSDCDSLTVAAGSLGFIAGASPEIIGEAIGDHAESPSLRVFSGMLSLAEDLSAQALREAGAQFEGLVGELSREAGASRMVIAAYMRLLMTAAWRLRGPGQEEEPQAAAGAILQRFRQSVEVGFRRHRTIGDYAAELGISADRLHAICQRTLARSPLELVHDRLVQEAKLRLDRSARSVQEISDGLGFRDPANFTHFFKRKTGLSPTTYRAVSRDATTAASLGLSASYYDWP